MNGRIDKFISNDSEFSVPFCNMLRQMTDEQLRELFESSKFPKNEDFIAIIDSKMNKNDCFDKEYMIDLLEAYFHHDPETASLWIQAERERKKNEEIRQCQELERQANEQQRKIEFENLKQENDNKMSEMNQTMENIKQENDNKMSEMNQTMENINAEKNTIFGQVADKITEVDNKIVEVDGVKVNVVKTVDDKIVELEDRFGELMNGDPIGEVVMARDSIEGTTHPNLSARLKHDFSNLDSENVKGGYHHVKTIEERDSIPTEKKKIGMLCFVEDENVLFQLQNNDGVLLWRQFRAGGVETVKTIADRDAIPESQLYSGFTCFVIDESSTYIYMGNGQWAKSSTNAIFIGTEEPNDTSVLWIDDEDENVDASLDSDIITEIKTTIQNISNKTDEVYYALTKELDPGYFNGVLPGSRDVDETSKEATPDLDDGAKGTVERILLKRGLKNEIETLHEGELGFCLDTEELYVGNKGYVKLLARVGGLSSGGGSNNVTGEYIELVAPNNEKYRIRVNDDGDFICYNSVADTAENPTPDQAPRYSGLIINHVYGGGSVDANISPCSHGFIELYNKSENTINLKGLSIQYGELNKPWQVLPLRGIVKPMHSFLVRCAQHTDINRKTTRFKIKNYDMHWDIPLSNNGMKVYLGVGDTPLEVKNPANIDNLWTRQQGYIDLFAYGSTNPALGIDAYEKSGSADGFLKIGDMLTSVHRKDFQDTDSSFMDLEPINLKTADVSTYTPRCTKDGQWINYYNKLKLYEHKPSMINIGFGQDGNTTRVFTWHTKPTHNGFLLYKKKGEEKFTVVETQKETAWYYDTDATVHRVIIRNLTPGTYIYKAGEEGKWSDEYEFEVKVPTESDTIKILHTSDQQGINEEEYHVWRKANKVICDNEEFDFTINTGDISNDGGEFAFQWRYYYDFAKDNLCSKPHMTCCGNNDLTPNDKDKKKTDPTAFGWYATYENQHIPSCYSWNYGYIHFVALNSNTLQASDIVDQQIPWLREDLAKPENQKRWTIVYMHESPYTIIKQAKMSKFIDVFAEFGVDLVLCGHHHRYSRSHRMGAQTSDGSDVIDNENGCYYVMCQATGYKLMGKTAPTEDSKAPWRAKYDNIGNPMYIMWDVTHEKIVMRPYSIANILPDTDNDFNEPELIPFDDTLEITKPV